MKLNKHYQTHVRKALPAERELNLKYVFQTFQSRLKFIGTKPQFAKIFRYDISEAQILQN